MERKTKVHNAGSYNVKWLTAETKSLRILNYDTRHNSHFLIGKYQAGMSAFIFIVLIIPSFTRETVELVN
jgi:hypothetical protein